jgi:MSHA biogenesis protein MshK
MKLLVAAALANVMLVAATLAAGALSAQIINDPTRPPSGYAGVEYSGTPSGGPVLQSVMITPTLKAAIIDGEFVKLGGRFGDAQVVKISENEVVLRNNEQVQVLKMYPGVEKRDSARTAAKAPTRRAKETAHKSVDGRSEAPR